MSKLKSGPGNIPNPRSFELRSEKFPIPAKSQDLSVKNEEGVTGAGPFRSSLRSCSSFRISKRCSGLVRGRNDPRRTPIDTSLNKLLNFAPETFFSFGSLSFSLGGSGTAVSSCLSSSSSPFPPKKRSGYENRVKFYSS